MLFVFSANMHTFFYDNKGMFIDVFQSTAEMNTFIFGKDRNDHISCFFGITTTRLPPGCIPVEFIYDVIKDGFRFFFCASFWGSVIWQKGFALRGLFGSLSM